MDKQRRRRRSVVAFVALALIVCVVVGVAALLGRPEAVRQLWATATLDAQGHATVTESIDYHFSKERHGIYRVLPDVPYTSESQVQVSSDTLITPEGSGIRIRIGDPAVKVSGDHHYEIRYPLDTLRLHDGVFGWNGVGTSWDVTVEHAELDLVAPWTWDSPSCASGASGSLDPCTVTQPQPGHLVVSTGQHARGHGVTIYATRGAALASAPAPRTPERLTLNVPWWQRPVALGLVAGVLVLVAELAMAVLLRRRGRDWVMAGAASTGDAAGVAFSSGAGPLAGAPDGAMRVDDTKLAEWATTEFAPPKGITAWQGGVVAAETPRPEHRVAWLLGAAVDGYIDLDDQDPKAARITPLPHDVDATTALLAVAFDGRDEVQLGKYDRHFSSLWSSLPSMQKQWLRGSGFADVDADRRAGRSIGLGVLGCVLAAAVLVVAASASSTHPMTALVVIVLGALLGGLSLGAALRGWELRVRTPAGSATWLRIESFRHFLANSEAHHVAEAAKRGVLREYTAWAVALGEVDHWSKMADAAGLPPDTAGLHSALVAPMIASSFASTGTAPSSSGGGGGGVGGGGGGGGGGSW
jgi:hypothetical protein